MMHSTAVIACSKSLGQSESWVRKLSWTERVLV